jgi:hypothetical protein
MDKKMYQAELKAQNAAKEVKEAQKWAQTN